MEVTVNGVVEKNVIASSMTRGLLPSGYRVDIDPLKGPWESFEQLTLYMIENKRIRKDYSLAFVDGMETVLVDEDGNVSKYIREKGDWRLENIFGGGSDSGDYDALSRRVGDGFNIVNGSFSNAFNRSFSQEHESDITKEIIKLKTAAGAVNRNDIVLIKSDIEDLESWLIHELTDVANAFNHISETLPEFSSNINQELVITREDDDFGSMLFVIPKSIDEEDIEKFIDKDVDSVCIQLFTTNVQIASGMPKLKMLGLYEIEHYRQAFGNIVYTNKDFELSKYVGVKIKPRDGVDIPYTNLYHEDDWLDVTDYFDESWQYYYLYQYISGGACPLILFLYYDVCFYKKKDSLYDIVFGPSVLSNEEIQNHVYWDNGVNIIGISSQCVDF